MSPVERSADASLLLAGFGTATVCEAAGGEGIVDVDLKQVIPGSRVAGPARTVLCGQGNSLTTCSGYVPGKETDGEDPEQGSFAARALG